MKKIIVLSAIIILSLNLFAKTYFEDNFTITYRAPESRNDTRFDYPLALIKMAMEKTKAEYGKYLLVPAENMNFQRAENPEYISTLNNFIFETTVSLKNEKELLSVKIPIAKGIYGYRVFIIQKQNQKKINNIKTLEELKKLTIGQEMSWEDVSILRQSQFKVIEGNNYEGLFFMVNSGRFDLFARGVNEAFKEVEDRKSLFPDLVVEKTLCLYYPLPRYFYTAKKNILLAKRMTKGLEIMIEDGSFDKIWWEYHKKYVEEADFKNRKIFRIENNFMPENIPIDDEKYWFVPKK